MKHYYTGVGARKTPTDILRLMCSLANKLSHENYILRSGGAKGADQAFESGATYRDIYIASDCTPAAMDIAKQFHPAWDKCNEYVQKLHGRNALQVLGPDLNTASNFLVCWTPDGCIRHSERTIKTGGTGTAISIADAYAVPVLNLQRQDHFLKITKFINQ